MAPAQESEQQPSPVTLVVHAHFYQPPRENPWTEELNREASAAPFHDWNTRISAECYRPNAFARVLDDAGRVLAVVNNYEQLSFNVGPTLMSWLERHQPQVYDRILAAHRLTHGAIAQAFNHMILPLANEADTRTQVRWGLADFRHRFGVAPAGMWLPETAVNDATLAVLAEEGVGFTILAPSQARMVRPLAGGAWREPDPLDTRIPYRWRHPDGDDRGIDIVFYDGPLSHDLAFSPLPSEALVDRAASAARRRGGLVTVALDGETFGHHHKWADRALAYALTAEAPRRGVTVANLAGWLAGHRPLHEVTVRESAWSCAHGVGRWATDCGCSTGGAPGSNQQWRAPLRAALDILRDFGIEVFERHGDLFADGDPWAARDAYIDVLVGAISPDDFAARFIRGDRVLAFTLLEAQRNAMLMYTSCGWFFHDLAGLETIQVLRYGARVLGLLLEAGESPPRAEFMARLAEAKSFEQGDGRQIWSQLVLPARVGANRVAAHLVLADLFGLGDPADHLGNFALESMGAGQGARQPAAPDPGEPDPGEPEPGGPDDAPEPGGPVRLAWRRVRLTHSRTGRTHELVAVALRLGDREAAGAVRPAAWPNDALTLDTLRRLLEGGAPPGDVLQRVFAAFGPESPKGPGRVFDVSAMLPEAAEALLERAAAGLAGHLAQAAEPFLAAAHWAILTRPADAQAAGDPLPGPLRTAAEAAVAHRLEAHLAAGELRAAVNLAGQARSVGLRLDGAGGDGGGPAAAVGRIVTESVRLAVAQPAGEAAKAAVAALELGAELGISPNRDEAQELVYEALVAQARPDLRELADALGLSPGIFAPRP